MKLLGFEIGRARELALVPEPPAPALLEERGISPENPTYSLSDPRILDALGVGDGYSMVGPQNAMESAAVFSCVRVLAESLAQLPISIYRRDGKAREQIISTSLGVPPAIMSARDLLRSPNPVMNKVTFFECGQTNLALSGNAYLQRVFDTRSGLTIGFYPLPWSAVTPKVQHVTDAAGYPALAKSYQVGSVILGPEDIVHVPLLSFDGIRGLSPISLNRLGVQISLSQQRYAAKFYDNGARPAGVLEHPGKLSKEAADRLRENWTTVYAGAGNAGKVAILEEAMKFTELAMSMEDAQFIDTMKFSREQIASIFRVPPHMIGHLERATFSNIEQQGLDFTVYTLGPYMVKWETALSESLIPPSLRDEYYIKFNIDGLLRGDLKTRYAAFAVARQWGWLSADDIREQEDMSPLPNGEGTKYLQPLNMVPAGYTPAADPEPAGDAKP